VVVEEEARGHRLPHTKHPRRHTQTHTLRASAGKHRGPNRRGPRQAGTHHTKVAHRHTGFARAP